MPQFAMLCKISFLKHYAGKPFAFLVNFGAEKFVPRAHLYPVNAFWFEVRNSGIGVLQRDS